MDSTRASYSQVALVDGGGFFPETDAQQDAAWFLMDAMKTLGTVAVGTSERELRWGIAYLKAQVKHSGLPVVSANLVSRLLVDWASRLELAPEQVPALVLASGILGHEADGVATAFARAGLSEERRRTLGDWTALLLRRSLP